MGIFVSHSTTDHAAAEALTERLRAYGFEVFIAPGAIRAAEDWRSLIATAVRRSKVVVVLDSVASRGSPWVQQEAGMAMASGALLLPITLDDPGGVPAWLSGLQAVTWHRSAGLAEEAERIAEVVAARAEEFTAQLPTAFREPGSIAAFVLRVLWLDQFRGAEGIRGAWSLQYDRYLSLYYGGEPPAFVSQGASPTFTGMNVVHLREYLDLPGAPCHREAADLLTPVAAFLRASQDPDEGGFGKRMPSPKARGGHGWDMDLRHSCWALSSLLALHADRFAREIERGFKWLLERLSRRYEKDRWVWTSAAVAKVLLDPSAPVLERARRVALAEAVAAVGAAWAPSHGSWINEEPSPEMRRRIAVDNALYVLECVAGGLELSPELARQCDEAVDTLLDRCVVVADGSRGLPYFDSFGPEAGPTAQLVWIMDRMGRGETERMEDFVAAALSGDRAMPLTFSWHLSGALAVPRLAAREICSA